MQPTEPSEQSAPLRRYGLRNWRVSRRLIALILIPTALAAILGGLRIATSATSATAYSKVERLGKLAAAVTALTQDFAAERDLSAGFIAAGRPADQRGPIKDQYARVDADVVKVRSLAAGIDNSYGSNQVAQVRIVLNRLDGFSALRVAATDSKMPVVTVIEKYSESISELLSLLDGSTTGVADDTLARTARALGALSRAKEEASRLRAYLYSGLLSGSLPPDELAAALDAQARQTSELASFDTSASLDQLRQFNDTVIGPQVDQAGLLRQQVFTEASNGNGRLKLASALEAAQWMSNQTAAIGRMRVVEQRLGDDIVTRSRDQGDSAQTAAVVGGGAAAALLALVLLVTIIMARSLVLPLRRLRDGALEVAGASLPGLVHRLRDPEAASGGIEVAPIDIDTTDEIGQVARAFDEVHREAVRLAANEAVLRGNINAMFVNLSRRSQSLIERQLRLIDELEQGERDDDRLASLFRLDHLATRMRRNCENLLVLGGQDQVRRWNRPVPLIDVVRASLSEVEQYERVELRVQSEVSITGPVVNDLVHLVAELVENAIVFSPEHTAITVSGHLVSGGGIMVQITDQGVGMTTEELAEANQRLAAPPVADVSAARRMGLFVVGRLAARHGIRVELRTTVSGGVTAFALLPARVVAIAGEPVPAAGEPAAAGWNAFGPQPRDSRTTAHQVRPEPVRGVFEPQRPPAVPAPPPQQALPAAHQRQVQPNVLARPIWRTAQENLPVAAPLPAPSAPFVADPYQQASRDVSQGGRSRGHDPYESRPYEPMPYTDPKPMPRSAPGGYDQHGHPEAQTGPLPMVPPQRAGGSPRRPDPAVPWEPVVDNRQPAGGPWGPVPGGDPSNGGPPPPARRVERSPIFEAMTSEWFQSRSAADRSDTPDPAAWRSPADDAWQAAQATATPAASGRTSAGLPKRVPGQNRVPGAVPRAAASTPAPATGPPRGSAPQRPPAPAGGHPAAQNPDLARQSAEAIRARFGGFQRGVHRGRSETSTGTWTTQGQPGSESSETGENT